MTRVQIAMVLALAGCGRQATEPKTTVAAQTGDAQADGKAMAQHDDLDVVRNDTIQYATYRPPGATLPTRGRQIMVVAPPEAVALVRRGDIALLDQLVPLLADPKRMWAAEVMLAALTGNDADLVNDFQGPPEKFVAEWGEGAQERWQKWLDSKRGKLQWDASRNQFVAK
jgi:hypothetical protein